MVVVELNLLGVEMLFEVDVVLNDSNKKHKEQFNSKQHKVNIITIYSEYEFQNLFRMIYLIMCWNDYNLIRMRACNIYDKIYNSKIIVV